MEEPRPIPDSHPPPPPPPEFATLSLLQTPRLATEPRNPETPKVHFKVRKMPFLVSHYSAIGDTISCDAPSSAIGFRGKLFLRYPPFLACLLTAIGHLQGKKWGCSSDSLRYHRKHSATGALLHLSRDRGGYFGRVAKMPFWTPRKKWLQNSIKMSKKPVCGTFQVPRNGRCGHLN